VLPPGMPAGNTAFWLSGSSIGGYGIFFTAFSK
jgi:hypothetical protein